MSKRYKLLRELPGYKAGTVFMQSDGIWNALNSKNLPVTSYLQFLLNEAPIDWFEELPPKPTRWRAGEDEGYFYVTAGAIAFLDNDDRTGSDDDRYTIGNYFEYKATAAKVAEAVKALYAYVHTDGTYTKAWADNNIEQVIDNAREAVQSDNQLHKEG